MKLPEPAFSRLAFIAHGSNKSPVENFYTADQMRQYRLDTLEEAARLCEAHAVSCMLLSEIDQNFPLHQHHLSGEQAAQHLMRIVRKLKEKKHERT